MGEAIEALSGKLGLDTTDFKAGISAANRELRVLESGFRASAAGLGDWTKSADGLEMRVKSLTSQIEIQQSKVAALREEYERVKAEKGENSKAAQDLEIKLNKEVETLGKMQNELGESEQALQEMGNAEDEVGNSADEAGGKVNSFSEIIGGAGTVIKGSITFVMGLVVAVAALAAGLGGLIFSTASTSAELVDLSAKTGISTTRLQELAYVGEQVGTSQDTITMSLARLTRSMAGAQQQQADYLAAQAEAAAKGEEFDGTLGDTAAAFDRLGVRVADSSGNLRDSEAVFTDLLTALQSVPNEAERDALAMSLFGKSAMELNPLIKAGSDELARLSQQAHEVGAVMSEEDVAAFEAFDDTLASLQMGLKGTVGTLMSAFLPGFQSVFDQAGGYLREFATIVKGSDGDISKIAQGLGGLVGKIIGDMATQAPQMLQAGLGILQSIVDAIVANLPVMIPAAISMITSLLEFLVANLPTIIDAGLQILIALVQGIAEAMPTLIPAILSVIQQIVLLFWENLPLIVDVALQIIMALIEGLVASIPILLPVMPEIMQAMVDALIAVLPLIGEAAVQIIMTLINGMAENGPKIIPMVEQLVGIFLGAWQSFFTTIKQVGADIVDGVWQGIQDNADWFYGQVVAFFTGIVDAVKNALGINSPARAFIPIGKSMPEGVEAGVKSGMPSLQKYINTAMLALSSVSFAPSVTMPSYSGGDNPVVSEGGRVINVGGIEIFVDARGAKDPEQVGQATQAGVMRVLRSIGAM